MLAQSIPLVRLALESACNPAAVGEIAEVRRATDQDRIGWYDAINEDMLG